MYSKTCIQTPSLYATFIVNINSVTHVASHPARTIRPVIRPDPSARSSDPLPRCDFYRPIRLTRLTHKCPVKFLTMASKLLSHSF